MYMWYPRHLKNTYSRPVRRGGGCADIELKKCFLTDIRQPNQNSTIILRFLDT